MKKEPIFVTVRFEREEDRMSGWLIVLMLLVFIILIIIIAANAHNPEPAMRAVSLLGS